MGIVKRIILTALMAATALQFLSAQDARVTQNRDILLADVSANAAQYKSKDLTLRLRLKHVDRIFEKIIFYDRKNHDIEFDISGKARKKRLEHDMRDIHEGMYYFVTFTVLKIGAAGEIVAELIGFRPVFLENIPERGDRKP